MTLCSALVGSFCLACLASLLVGRQVRKLNSFFSVSNDLEQRSDQGKRPSEPDQVDPGAYISAPPLAEGASTVWVTVSAYSGGMGCPFRRRSSVTG